MPTNAKSTITKDKIIALVTTIGEQYAAELDSNAKSKERPFGFTKKQIEDLKAGHADGLRNMVAALRAQGIITVED
jgi:hypothetical protein